MQSIDDLIERTGIELRLVQIDTLARAFGGGNENDSQDMGAFIHNAGRLQRKLDCALMVLHHSGKDATKGLRGHSSLLGAVDTQLELQKLEQEVKQDGIAGKGVITVSKQKDGQDNIKFGFEMILIDINQKLNDALELSESMSLAVREALEMVPEEHKKKKEARVPPDRSGAGGVQKVALDALHKAISDHGEMRLIDGKRNKTVYVEQWQQAFEAAQTDKAGIKKRFTRCVLSLQNAKKVEVFDPFVWVIWEDGKQDKGDF
jgi:RecA-family ATPase